MRTKSLYQALIVGLFLTLVVPGNVLRPFSPHPQIPQPGTLQTTNPSSNATIAVQPHAIVDLDRSMTSIKVELALNNTPDVPPFNGVQIELHYDPKVLNATSLDYSANVFAQTSFPTFIVRDCLDGRPGGQNLNFCGQDDGPGFVSFAETIAGGSTSDGTQGNIFFLTFKVNTTASSFSQIQIRTAILSNGKQAIPSTNVDGYYTSRTCGNVPCSPSIPSLTWVPQTPLVGTTVVFRANSSLPSPGASITDFSWTFGDSGEIPYRDTFANSTALYNYRITGVYSVTLTITDSNGIKTSITKSITVVSLPTRPPPPDFQIQLLYDRTSTVIFPSETITLQVLVEYSQFGPFVGPVTLIGEANPQISNAPTFHFSPTVTTSLSRLTISTTELTPSGNYTVTVIGSAGPLVRTANLQITVLPLPVLAVDPSSGPVGTLVTVHGSGFVNQLDFSGVPVDVTFDDQLANEISVVGGSFNFTFSIPIAQPGAAHFIHAKAHYLSIVDVRTSFQVLPEPSVLNIGLTSGAIYFPGDTVAIFIVTSMNGQAITVTSLNVIMVGPTGLNSSLSPVLVSPGIYKIMFAVPTSRSTGTYAVIVTAHQNGSIDTSATTGFEVKPSWLHANGQNILTVSAIIGAIGTLGVAGLAGKRAHFSRRKDPFSIP